MRLICVSKLTITGSDNGLTPGRRQAIIWTNAGMLLIGPLGTNFGEILIEIYKFSLKKMHLKMSSRKLAAILSRPQFVNSLAFRDVATILKVQFSNSVHGLNSWALPVKQQQVNATELHWWQVNISSDNDFGPSDNKPLPELVLTNLCHHMPLGHNEFSPVMVNLLRKHKYLYAFSIISQPRNITGCSN